MLMLAMSPEVNSFDHEIEETEEILSNTAKEGGITPGKIHK